MKNRKLTNKDLCCRLYGNDDEYLYELAKLLYLEIDDVVRRIISFYRRYNENGNRKQQPISAMNDAIDNTVTVMDFRKKLPDIEQRYLLYVPDTDSWIMDIWLFEDDKKRLPAMLKKGWYHWLPIPDMRIYLEYKI